LRVEGQDVEVSPDEYARIVGEAAEVRIRVLLADLPAGVVLRAPEDVAESAAAFVQAEQARLNP
jgi:hypothetical protein